MFDDEDLLFFAAKHYYNPRGNNVEEFYDDLSRITYIKRLISRYEDTKKMPHRLLMNHIIVFCNAFTIKASLKIFEEQLNERSWEIIKPFLIELKYISKVDYPKIQSDSEMLLLLGKS